jgi:hypothetical protein
MEMQGRLAKVRLMESADTLKSVTLMRSGARKRE